MNLRISTPWRATVLVGIVLAVALAATGVAASAYRAERIQLGREHFARAQQLAAQNDTDKAIDEYRQALVFQPDDADYRLYLADTLLQSGRLDEAESHFEQLSDEDPENPLVSLGLARVALRRGQVKRAILQYQHSVYAYWPPNLVHVRRDARWELIHLLEQNGRRNEAIGELMQLYAGASDDRTISERVGFLLLQYGAISEAYRVFSSLAREYPSDATVARGLAQTQFAFGNYLTARHAFEHALHLNPKDEQAKQGLQLTNTVIDLSAGQAGITQRERLRRSEGLLRRVLDDVSGCSGLNSFQAEKVAAEKLLDARHVAGEDTNLEMQQAAQQLWNDRPPVCAVQDAAASLVLARNTNE